MPIWGSLYFQNSSSHIMEQLIFFHDHIMVVMILVMGGVGYLLFSICLNNFYNSELSEGQELEFIWTILPGLFLMVVAFPSIRLLYMMEEFSGSEMSIKVVGHQWYWSYEYSDLGIGSFDSYMLGEDYMFRLIEVDNCLVTPYNTSVRMIVSSEDVIHSWTIPSLGVKVDAIPGRLNQLFYEFKRPGMFMGQCSEICGANHSFMPIVIKVVSLSSFLDIFV